MSSGLKSTLSLTKSISKTEQNLLSLVHSALDISPPLYNFALWLNSNEFTSPIKSGESVVSEDPLLSVNCPIVFENYNQQNGMGYGLKCFENVTKGSVLIKQSTEMGLISKDFLQTPLNLKDDKESKQKDIDDSIVLIQNITSKVAKTVFGQNPVLQNRLYQHLMLTQKLIAQDRKENEGDTISQFMKAYVDILPVKDMTGIVFWDEKLLADIDSETIRAQYSDTMGYYRYLYKLLTEDPESPYFQKNSLPIEQFLWAFSLVSSRHLIMNNEQPANDANLVLMMAPFIDMINHSFEPNVIALPYEDKINNSSFIIVQALRDIKKDEQLFFSYGNLSNTHLIQKYGFTLENNPNNYIAAQLPWRDYQALIFEELKVKQQIASRLSFPFNQNKLMMNLYKNKFNPDYIRMLRFSFLNSKHLMNLGTQRFTQQEEFKNPFDAENEHLCWEFMTINMDRMIQQLKKPQFYKDKINELNSNMDSIEKYNRMNMYRLQIDEYEILKGNLDYIIRTRDTLKL